MADTTTRSRPAWLVLTVLAAVIIAAVFIISALVGDTGNETNTDPLVDALCVDSADC